MGDFRAGEVLSRSIKVWGKNFIPFTVVSFLCFVPDFIFTYLSMKDGLHMSLRLYVACSMALGWLLAAIATSAISFGVFQELRGRPASLGESISVGMSRILAVLGTSILTGLVVGMGYVLLVIPGIVFSTMLFVAVPAAVV